MRSHEVDLARVGI